MSHRQPTLLMVALEGISVIIPLILITEVFIIGLFPTLWYMLLHPRSIPFPKNWRDSFHHAAEPFLTGMADRLFGEQKRQLIMQARGRVLEIGAGTGGTVKYYDKTKVDVVYGVEPNLLALESLKVELKKHDLMEKYEILSFGIEDTHNMTEAGVTPESIDTVVCVLCLCSVPMPEKIVAVLYSYLKSGGTLLVFEHVGSEYRPMRFLQTLYTKACWRYVMGGCELNRPTRRFLLEAERKEWKEVQLKNNAGQGWWSLLPLIIGKLVKA